MKYKAPVSSSVGISIKAPENFSIGGDKNIIPKQVEVKTTEVTSVDLDSILYDFVELSRELDSLRFRLGNSIRLLKKLTNCKGC